MICTYCSLEKLENFSKNSSPPMLNLLHPASEKKSINSVIKSIKKPRASSFVKILKHCALLPSDGNKLAQL